MLKCLLFFTTMLLSFGVLSGGVVYPGNPIVSDAAFFFVDRGVTRFDRENNRVAWHYPVNGRVFAPAVGEGLVVLAGEEGVYALDAGSGVLRWRLNTKGAFSPLIDGEAVYVAEASGTISALGSAHGRLRWRRKLGIGWVYPPAVDGGLLITGGQDGVIWAVGKHSGEIVWRNPVGQELVYSPIVLNDGVTLVNTFAGESIAVASKTGEILWRTNLGVPGVDVSQLGELILVVGMDNGIRAVDRNSGEAVWERHFTARPRFPARLHREALIVLLDDGWYQWLDPSSGDPLGGGKTPVNLSGGALLSTREMLVIREGRNETHSQPVIMDMR